jgi:hypothetical protein
MKAKTSGKKAPLPSPAASLVSDVLLEAAKLVGIKKATTETKLADLLQEPDGLGDLDWVLVVLSLEIDLRVNVPEKLAESHKLTIGEFAAKVAALPEQDDPYWTLNRLSTLTDAILCCHCDDDEDEEDEAPPKQAGKPAKAAKPAKPAKPAKKPAKAAKPAKRK